MRTIKTYRKVGAFYIACEEDFATSIVRSYLGLQLGAIGVHRETAMPRTRPLISPLFLAAIIALLSTQAAAQELKSSGLPRWDSTNQVLFFDSCSMGGVVRAYADGHQRGADIDITKDFPGIQDCYVEKSTAGPDGTTLIAAILNFGTNANIRETILTYDSSGKLLKSWDPAPQCVEAIAYSKDDSAVLILGERSLPNGPYAPNYPLLVEYRRDGNVQKVMIPAGALKNGGDSFHQGGQFGETTLRVTKDQVYFYAPTNREAVITDRDGVVLADRSISGIIEKISMEYGYHLVQVHALDFSDDGDIVLELLRSNDVDYRRDVVRINNKSGEAFSVRRALPGKLWFVGLKDGQYVYIENGQRLVIQPAGAQELLPLASNLTR